MANPSSIQNGFYYDQANARLDIYYRGTRRASVSASQMAIIPALAVTGAATLSGGVAVTGSATLASGNVVLGTPGNFATTQPVAGIKMGGSSLSGVAPVGAITTAAGLFASDTVVRKIIADGTASNVET